MGQSVLFYLTVSGFARINSFLDGLNLCVDVRLNVDLLAVLTARDVEERTAATHILCQGAAEPAASTRAYRIASNR